MEKKLGVVMLPTDKWSTLVLRANKMLINFSTPRYTIDSNDIIEEAQHLYFTSDSPIKEGDWCILFGDCGNAMSNPQQWLGKGVLNNGLKKIVATTDKSLKLRCVECKGTGYDYTQYCNDKRCPKCCYKEMYIPQIPQSFLSTYVDSNGSIDEVEVGYKFITTPNPLFDRSKGVNSRNPTYLNTKRTTLKLNNDNEVIII